MEARNRRLPDWFARIRTRQVVLPRFQRMEAWGYREVADLLETVAHGLPAGAALTLEVGKEPPFPERAIVGAPEDGEKINEQLLDGQQRLTALWRSLNDDYPDRTFFIDLLNPDDGKPQIDPVSRWIRNEKRYPLWADDPAQCWKRKHIPVSLMRPGDEMMNLVYRWAGEASNGDLEEKEEIVKRITSLRGHFSSFNLPFLSLPVGTERSVALDVFIKMNTRTVRLTAFDIVVAMMEDAAGQSLHDLMRGFDGSVPGLSSYGGLESFVLSAVALRQGRTPTTKGWMEIDFDKMIEEWPILVGGAAEAVRFLTQERVPDEQRLPTQAILPVLIALCTDLHRRPDAAGNQLITLRKYLWRSFFTDRYERSVSTAVNQDYRSLKLVLAKQASTEDVPIFDESRHPLPDIDIVLQAGWPKKRDRLARALLQLSLRAGALDIADGREGTREHLQHREYHHLFPVAHLGSHESVEEGEAHRALNCALISWKTNRTISAKDPLTYLRERAQASALGEAEIRRRLATHAVPWEPLISGDYHHFLEERARMLMPGIRSLCNGEAWSPV